MKLISGSSHQLLEFFFLTETENLNFGFYWYRRSVSLLHGYIDRYVIFVMSVFLM
jgi:hypothetical protein